MLEKQSDLTEKCSWYPGSAINSSAFSLVGLPDSRTFDSGWQTFLKTSLLQYQRESQRQNRELVCIYSSAHARESVEWKCSAPRTTESQKYPSPEENRLPSPNYSSLLCHPHTEITFSFTSSFCTFECKVDVCKTDFFVYIYFSHKTIPILLLYILSIHDAISMIFS